MEILKLINSNGGSGGGKGNDYTNQITTAGSASANNDSLKFDVKQ